MFLFTVLLSIPSSEKDALKILMCESNSYILFSISFLNPQTIVIDNIIMMIARTIPMTAIFKMGVEDLLLSPLPVFIFFAMNSSNLTIVKFFI